MFAILAYIGFLGLFFAVALGLFFGLRTAKII